jgi:hypothetical protein
MLNAEEEGGTVLDHLRAIEEQTGQTPQMLLDAPHLPAGCEELWRVFSELHSCRGNSGFGPLRITYADIDAFQRVSGVMLQPWELDAIRRADAAYLTQWAERNRRND